MLTLEAHQRKSNIKRIARSILSSITSILSQHAKTQRVVAAEFILQGNELYSKLFIQVGDTQLRSTASTSTITLPVHNLNVERFSIYIFIEDFMWLHEHMNLLDENPDTVPPGLYTIEQDLDTSEMFGTLRAIAIIPSDSEIAAIDLRDPLGRRAIEAVYAKLRETITHELIHAQQDIESTGIQQDDLTVDEYMTEDPYEVEALIGQVKSRAGRLVRLMKRDRAKYIRNVDFIEDPELHAIAIDVPTLMEHPDRYELMFRIALEVFLTERGVTDDPMLADKVRDQYLTFYRKKYRGINENIVRHVLTKLLEYQYLVTEA